MFPPSGYTLEWALDQAGAVYDRTWRMDFTAPGFCLIPLPANTDSHALRATMLDVKDRLSAELFRRRGRRFVFRSLGRFDQQVTTKFHLDGAPDESLLMLGYEPSAVRSRLALADYTRCAFDMGITPRQFLTDYNPMFPDGARRLAPYVTALQNFDPRRPAIVLINNSSLPYAADGSHPLGVMHQADIPEPSAHERRIVNSAMIGVVEVGDDIVGPEGQGEFVRTDQISQRY